MKLDPEALETTIKDQCSGMLCRYPECVTFPTYKRFAEEIEGHILAYLTHAAEQDREAGDG